MTLIKSISGIRGTIGGPTGDTLNPLDIVKFTTAYATFMKRGAKGEGRNKIVVGRDARISRILAAFLDCIIHYSHLYNGVPSDNRPNTSCDASGRSPAICRAELFSLWVISVCSAETKMTKF